MVGEVGSGEVGAEEVVEFSTLVAKEFEVTGDPVTDPKTEEAELEVRGGLELRALALGIDIEEVEEEISLV